MTAARRADKKRLRTSSRPVRRLPAPSIDPHLDALLRYIDGSEADPSATASHAATHAVAQRIVASAPESFLGTIDAPGVFQTITRDAAARYAAGGKEDAPQALVLRQILSVGEEDLTDMDSTPAFYVLVRCVSDAYLMGACVMFALLKGGAK